MRKLIIIIILLMAACIPLPDATPTPVTEWLNRNPDMDFGACETVVFETDQWGIESIQQCWPDGYTLYTVQPHNPIRVNYTGAAYSIQPLDNNGSIGYRLPPMELEAGEYIVKAYGYAHVWGPVDDWDIRAHYIIEGRPGSSFMGAMPLVANGPYRAMFVLDAPQDGIYTVSIYLRLVHASMTADSYITFERITVEEAPDD